MVDNKIRLFLWFLSSIIAGYIGSLPFAEQYPRIFGVALFVCGWLASWLALGSKKLHGSAFWVATATVLAALVMQSTDVLSVGIVILFIGLFVYAFDR